MKSHLIKNIITLTLLVSALEAEAGMDTWDFASNIDLSTVHFTGDARWPGQDTAKTQLSIASTSEFRWRGENTRASIIPYLRWDETDDERSLADLREAYWARQAENFELLIGVNTVFWGVTESTHLVDVINQTDNVADIDGEDKLGQPMINFEIQRDWGLMSAYLLPYFRERSFAGEDGRLRTPWVVDTGSTKFESSEGKNHIDLALRYSHYIGSVDFALSAFSGTSREPRLLPDAKGNALIPIYEQIDQFGFELQYTGDAWLWKLEAIARETKNNSFSAVVGGFEYTVYQVAESAADIGLLLELQHDGRETEEPVTLADNDLFVGIRLALNDTQDTAILASVGYDVETSESYLNIEADRRLGEDYVLELRVRFFENAEVGDIGYAIASDDYLQLQLSRYF